MTIPINLCDRGGSWSRSVGRVIGCCSCTIVNVMIWLIERPLDFDRVADAWLIRRLIDPVGELGHAERSLAAMLVHQAKNRDFDRVIVLWPFEIAGNEERERRLTYNAITRARREAIVIVHGEARLAAPPFVPSAAGNAAPRKRRSAKNT